MSEAESIPVDEQALDTYQSWAITFAPEGTGKIMLALICEIRRLRKFNEELATQCAFNMIDEIDRNRQEHFGTT